MTFIKNQTKYSQLADTLYEQFKSQQHGKRMPSIRALMKRFGVSQHTVMSALRILEEKDLIERRHGSGVYRSDSTKTPVIIFSRPDSTFAGTNNLVDNKENYLFHECRKRNWLLEVKRYDPLGIDHFSNDSHADGFVILPELINPRSPYFQNIIQTQTPLVVLGRDTRNAGLDFVTGDDSALMQDMVKHLSKLGHRKIALLVNEDHFYEIQERIKTFCYMCDLLDLEKPLILDVKARYGQDSITQTADFLRDYFKKLKRAPLPFTAIITCSSAGSPLVLRTALEAGYRVPDDLSICGLNALPMAQYYTPSISDTHSPAPGLAAAAISILNERMKGNDSLILYQFVPSDPTWRESVAPPKAKKRSSTSRQKR